MPMDKRELLERKVFNLLLLSSGLSVRVIEKHVFGQYRLTYPKFLVLNILIKKGEAVYPSYVAERMRVSNANMTGLVARMKKDGLISKRPDKLDKRAYYLEVTELGKTLYEEALPQFGKYIESVLEKVTDKELSVMGDTLTHLYTTFSEESTTEVEKKV